MCFLTWIKYPLAKYIPSDKTAAHPIKAHTPFINWATDSPGWKTIPFAVVKGSPSKSKDSPDRHLSVLLAPLFK